MYMGDSQKMSKFMLPRSFVKKKPLLLTGNGINILSTVAEQKILY